MKHSTVDTYAPDCYAAHASLHLLGLEEALRLVRSRTAPLSEGETTKIGDATCRALFEDVRATMPAPPFDASAMDGYAFNTSGLRGAPPYTLTVVDRIAAGTSPKGKLSVHEAAQVFTGAPVPKGADTVLMQEEIVRSGHRIRVCRRPVQGENIRYAGEQFKRGEIVLRRGRRFGPLEVGTCAAAGVTQVKVTRRLRVAILVTGDELRKTGSSLGAPQIWDVNSPTLTSALTDPTVEICNVGAGADSLSDLSRQIAKYADGVDLLVTTGGISVGEEDHVRTAFETIGGKTVLSGVAVKPGKPVSFGRLNGCHWLGLPGNPCAAYLMWLVFGRAVVADLLGLAHLDQPVRKVILARPITHKTGRCELRPATIVGVDDFGREIVDFDDSTYSGRIASLVGADGIVILPADLGTMAADSLAEFHEIY